MHALRDFNGLNSWRNAANGFVTLTGFTPNLGKLSMAALRNVNGLASRRHTENSLQSLNLTMPAKVLIERWRQHYNPVRPPSSLGYRPPAPETVLPNVDGPTYDVEGLRLAPQLNPRPTPS